MSDPSGLNVSDLRSVREAERASSVIGEDWASFEGTAERELPHPWRKRGLFKLMSSPIARKIVAFNLMPLIVLVAGVLYLDPSRDHLEEQHRRGLSIEAGLVAEALAARVQADGAGLSAPVAGGSAMLGRLGLGSGNGVYLFDASGALLAAQPAASEPPKASGLILTDALDGLWARAAGLVSTSTAPRSDTAAEVQSTAARALAGEADPRSFQDAEGRRVLAAASAIRIGGGEPIGAVTLTSSAGGIDALVQQERETLLRMFVLAVLVAIASSVHLASAIANPLADLAAAAELGRTRNARKMAPSRVRIPDMTGRPDEIGRLSGALRGMVSALYDRIEVNEQFAADVAHEIKNPLASLRSAVGTLRSVKREDHRAQLLDVIEHDVVRLDRLVSDISNASRLDSELVREEETEFDLLKLLENLNAHLGEQAAGKDIDYISDLPEGEIMISGIEARLAQVFVNLISNAISFCEGGDAIRVWVRQRENRVLVVVEDTGPGIEEDALEKIFRRFYSHRPVGEFGNHSGLGLSISKQIVEAHGGAIWAENIRPTETDPTSEPLGARFVVGLSL